MCLDEGLKYFLLQNGQEFQLLCPEPFIERIQRKVDALRTGFLKKEIVKVMFQFIYFDNFP